MIPTTRALDEGELEQIDRASKDLLWRVGVSVAQEEALAIYRGAGAKVDDQTGRVRLPGEMIVEATSLGPHAFLLHGRGARRPLAVGEGEVHFGPIGFATSVLDGRVERYRPALSSDMTDAYRLADALHPPDFVVSSITPTDVPPEDGDLYEFKAGLLNTRKHLIAQAQGARHLEKLVAMAEEVSGGHRALAERPFFSVMVCLTSPLVLRRDATELIIRGAERSLPLFIEAGPMCGATAPATLAATLVGANAELLSALVLAKLVNPSVPVVYASWARAFDMKAVTVSHGGPEFGLLRIATTQMARRYRLPAGGGGMLADSKLIDVQLGMEKLATGMLPALAGTDMILGMGLTASETAFSPEALVIDSEIARYVRRVLQGISMGEGDLGLHVFEEAGPGGHFLDRDHTVEHFRQEMWLPELLDRSPFKQDEDPRPGGLRCRAWAAAEEALRRWSPPDLPPDIEGRLDAIIQA